MAPRLADWVDQQKPVLGKFNSVWLMSPRFGADWPDFEDVAIAKSRDAVRFVELKVEEAEPPSAPAAPPDAKRGRNQLAMIGR